MKSSEFKKLIKFVINEMSRSESPSEEWINPTLDSGKEYLRQLCSLVNLSEREKTIFDKLMEGYTLQEIADFYKVSRSRIERIRDNLFSKLRFAKQIDDSRRWA